MRAAGRYVALAFVAAQWPFKYDDLQRQNAVGFSGRYMSAQCSPATATHPHGRIAPIGLTFFWA